MKFSSVPDLGVHLILQLCGLLNTSGNRKKILLHMMRKKYLTKNLQAYISEYNCVFNKSRSRRGEGVYVINCGVLLFIYINIYILFPREINILVFTTTIIKIVPMNSVFNFYCNGSSWTDTLYTATTIGCSLLRLFIFLNSFFQLPSCITKQ